MRCLMCERFSLSHICRNCRITHLTPVLHKRKILGSIPVYSFFSYSEIEPLLLSKHTDLGYYVYSILAQQAMKAFAQEWRYDYPVASVCIDDHVKNGYSHTALLNRALKSRHIKPVFGKMRAGNNFTYAGKSVQERLQNPREFHYLPFEYDEVILVDDIITTGATLSEAAETLHANGKKVILCLTLSDAETR